MGDALTAGLGEFAPVAEMIGVIAPFIIVTVFLFKNTDAMVKAGCKVESSARHALANTQTAALGKLEGDFKAVTLRLERDVDELKRDTARHHDLREMETRLKADIGDLKADMKELRTQGSKMIENQAELKVMLRQASKVGAE